MRVAYFSPLNPQRSGISDYSEELLPYLGRYLDITLFVERGLTPAEPRLAQHLDVRSLDQLPAHLFRGAGLRDVEERAIEVPTVFRDFEDYWSPFLGGQGPAPGYAMGLDEARRTALRDRLRSALPVTPDGSTPLHARAWAVRGTRS